MVKFATLAVALILSPLALSAESGAGAGALDLQDQHAGNDLRNVASLQRGARNFMNYCSGCHSLKYLRYARVGEDLHIPEALLRQELIVNGDKPTDYIQSTLLPADGEAWFGKAPPDLSLIGRSRSPDYLYRFLKGFYADASRPTGSNNLVLANPAMPAVLSELEGVKTPVYRNVEVIVDGEHKVEKRLDHLELSTPGALSAEEYDGFVRDTVNFLDYAGEPAQVQRHDIGIWAVLFLLVFTWISYLLKQEYWKDVH